MTNHHLKSMSVDELWSLHEELVAELGRKIAIEKARLEERQRKIGSASVFAKEGRPRRSYPKVLPKYRNPKNTNETWAGRGKQPRWLTALLRSGKKLEDFRIQRSSAR